MTRELQALAGRIERLEMAVGEIRDRLKHCLQVAARPQDAMALARTVAETLAKRVLQDLSLKPPDMLEACLKNLEEPRVMNRGLVPNEILSLFHLVRVFGNRATHDALRIAPTSDDVVMVLYPLLRIVEWYFAEFERGPQLTPLFRPPPDGQGPDRPGEDDPLADGWRPFAFAYLEEVWQKFEYWHHRYVSLPAAAQFPPPPAPLYASGSEADWTPRYFRPRGYRLVYPRSVGEPLRTVGETREFGDVRQALAVAGDAVLLGNPGAGKTTSLWRLMLDYSRKARSDPAAPLPVLIPLGGYDGEADVLGFVQRQLVEAVIEDNEGHLQPLYAHRALAARLPEGLAQRRLALLFDGVNEMPRDRHGQPQE